MIVVLAVGIWLWLSRWDWTRLVDLGRVIIEHLQGHDPPADWPTNRITSTRPPITFFSWQVTLRSIGHDLARVVVGLLFVASPAVLVLRFRRLRPPFRPLACRPGTLACASATLAWLGLIYLTQVTRFFQSFPLVGGSSIVAAWVALGWLGLWRLRGWQPEPSWLDRLGRALGIAWLAIGGVVSLAQLVESAARWTA